MRHLALTAVLAALAAAPVLAAEPETRVCLDNRSIKATRFSPDQGYFARSGGRWFQNRAGGCPLFAEGRSIQTISTASRLCNGDQVDIYQPVTGLVFGTCALGEWTEVAAESVPK